MCEEEEISVEEKEKSHSHLILLCWSNTALEHLPAQSTSPSFLDPLFLPPLTSLRCVYVCIARGSVLMQRQVHPSPIFSHSPEFRWLPLSASLSISPPPLSLPSKYKKASACCSSIQVSPRLLRLKSDLTFLSLSLSLIKTHLKLI